ncbi:ribonuclease R [Clostridiales bacterium KA00134]|nr:ribonuclease R [Clostridiales bacterium KA00134]
MIREALKEILSDLGPVKFKTLAKYMQISNKDKKDFAELLREMEKNGEIFFVDDKYQLEGENLIKGQIQGNSKGFSFLLRDEGKDIFIAREDKLGAMDGDSVLVKITKACKEKQSFEGKVVKILKRANKDLVGTYQDSGKFGFVVPLNDRIDTDIFIPGGKNLGAKTGQRVLVKIDKWQSGKASAEGHILEVFGYPEDRGVDILTIARNFNLPQNFPKEVLDEIKKIPDKVLERDLKNRRDFTKDRVFTIDGKDSKDFDDAVSINFDGKYYELKVHIADVAFYVEAGSALDQEALKRGNSYYLLTKVIPMLPEELSNGICSLNEGQNRLTLSVLMKIDTKGKVVESEICEGYIRSCKRLVYDTVSDFLEDGKEDDSLEGLYEDLKIMGDLQKVLYKKRLLRGSIDFNFKETKIDLDSKDRPVKIYPYERRIANRIIEEFMILTNEVVAEEYFWREIPFVYRVHDEPSLEKIASLNQMLRPLNLKIKNLKEISPRSFQEVIDSIKGQDDEEFVSTIILRSMQKAGYDTEERGHFGLGARYYSHFTSPIRRYSDLIIHRIIKENIHNKFSKKRFAYYEKVLPGICKKVSEMELVQDEAERAVKDAKIAQYMKDKIGEVYDAKITGITNFGIFAALENTVEGLISYQSIDEYLEYDDSTYTAISRDSGIIYKLGDEIRVRLVNVNLDKAQIDFELLSSKEEG